MMGVDTNPYPIQLLVNYWEIRPSQMGKRLDELLRRGVTHLASFVPWQVVESDISHGLTRFLQAISDRRMTISLILTPEVGVHYPNSGLPKDVIARKENMASHGPQGRDAQVGPIPVTLPPNAFQLPSLFASELNKRYYSFLSRMDGILADLGRNQPSLVRGVTIVTTGSFWKYYRSPLASAESPFAGAAGDYSGAAAVSFRQRLEQFLSQREFMDPSPAAANRWKTRALEEMNRRWFYQQSEDVFKSRSAQLLRKRSTQIPMVEMELYTPEADPSMTYSNFLQMVSGGQADFARLSQLVDASAARSGAAGGSTASSFIHWTSVGGFRGLNDAEKQFLLLKSLLLMGGQGGGILVDEGEWFSLSQNFRARAEAIARSISHGELKLDNRVIYLAPHLWSGAGTLWQELTRKVGPSARLVASLDLVLRERNANLLIVDPACVMTRDVVQKLCGWAKAGRVVVMPRSQLYTESARAELERILADTKKIEIDLGTAYRLHALGEGRLILFDLPDTYTADATKGEPLSAWQAFLSAVLSLAEVENYCRLSDSRLAVIPLRKNRDSLALFVLNSTRRQVAADILFPVKVSVTDLAISLSAHGALPARGDAPAPIPATRFSLDAPPFGILPLSVEGLIMGDLRERRDAFHAAEATRASALSAAASQLPGFDADQSSMEEVWN